MLFLKGVSEEVGVKITRGLHGHSVDQKQHLSLDCSPSEVSAGKGSWGGGG